MIDLKQHARHRYIVQYRRARARTVDGETITGFHADIPPGADVTDISHHHGWAAYL